MSIELRLPKITATSEREQLLQLKSYLYQLTEQLQIALNITAASDGSAAQQVVIQATNTPTVAPPPVDAAVTFAALKPLIIKSADIVEAYYEEINKKLEGLYVAQSDFGTYAEKTEQNIEANSKGITQTYENLQAIISDEIGGVNNTFNKALGDTDSRITEEVKALTNAIDDQIDVVNEKIDDVNESLAKTDGDIATVNARIDEANAQITETNTRIDDTNAKILATEKAITETNSRIDGVNESIGSVNNDIQGVNELISEANDKIDGLTEAIQDANGNIDELIEAKDLNAGDVAKINADIAKINGDINGINVTVGTITDEVSDIGNHVQEVDGQIDGINTSIGEVEKATGDLNKSVSAVEEEIGKTNEEVGKTSDAVSDLKTDVSTTKENVSKLYDAVDDANKQIGDLKGWVIETRGHIKSGEIDRYVDDYGNEFPVLGIEIGQVDTANGYVMKQRYARFTADKLSFYDQNGFEVAYISNQKLFIRNVELYEKDSSYKLGGFIDKVMSNGDVVTKWEGREQ